MTTMRKTFWIDAAQAGAVIGLVLTACMYINNFLNPGVLRSIISISEIVLFIYLTYRYAKKRSLRFVSEGFSYGQSMGFILTVMLFVGILYGFTYFILVKYISPGMLEMIINTSMGANPFVTPEMEGMLRRMLGGPVIWLFSITLSMLVIGGLLGLIVSALVKREPDVFANTDNTTINKDNE